MLSRSGSTASLTPPATVGNFGPGFDVASLALADVGDTIELTVADEDAIHVDGPGADTVPTDWHENVAGRCLNLLRDATGVQARFEVRLTKPRAAGSGLGSSASSGAGVALAFHALNPEADLAPETLVEAAGRAEVTDGQAHFDDVAAVVLGGLALVDPHPDGLRLSRVDPPDDLVLGVAVPELSRRTDEMRAVLPPEVPRADAVANLAALGRLVAAFHAGDVATVGACLRDELAVPHRTRKLGFYEPACLAAREAGAHGAVLSGSGPSIVAACSSRGDAERASAAMAETIEDHDVDADALLADPEHEVPYDVATMR